MFKSAKLVCKGTALVDFVGGAKDDLAGSKARPATAVGGTASRLAKPTARPATAVVKNASRSGMSARKSTADDSVA